MGPLIDIPEVKDCPMRELDSPMKLREILIRLLDGHRSFLCGLLWSFEFNEVIIGSNEVIEGQVRSLGAQFGYTGAQ